MPVSKITELSMEDSPLSYKLIVEKEELDEQWEKLGDDNRYL